MKNIKIEKIEADRYGRTSRYSFIFFVEDGIKKSMLLKNFFRKYGMLKSVQMYLSNTNKNGILQINKDYVYSML